MKITNNTFVSAIPVGLALILMAVSSRDAEAQNPINNSFESGDLQGWTLTFRGDVRVNRTSLDGTVTDFNIAYPYAFTTIPHEFEFAPGVSLGLDAGVINDSAVAREGDSYARLAGLYYFFPRWEMPDGFTYSLYSDAITLSLQQTVHLDSGQTLSGWVNYFNHCYLDGHNLASAYVNDTLVWDCLNPTLPPAVDWTGDWDDDVRSTGWVQWSYLALEDGDYTIAFDVDEQCQHHGWLLVDDLWVTGVQAVPEPGSLALCGMFAATAFGMCRRKR